MNSKDFELTMEGYVFYPNVSGDRSSIYIGDYDESVTLEEIENDFNEMLEQIEDGNGSSVKEDCEDRKALFAFVYYSVLCCKEF